MSAQIPTTQRIVVISGGLGNPSTTALLAGRIAESIRRRGSATGIPVEVEMIELRALAHEITDAMLTGFAGEALRPVLAAVTEADALVAVTPTFQASYSGLFKSFMDVVEAESLIGKPVLVAATGGTARHSMVIDHALRPLFSYLQAFVMPTGVFAGPNDWGDGSDGLAGRIDRAVGELISVLGGTGSGRGPADDFDLLSESMIAASRP